MGEFELIRQYFSQQSDAVVGIGDDAAVLAALPDNQQLVVCLDTLVAGRHFPENTAAADIGWKALAVNLSDLAAMGATPSWFQLGLTLPAVDESWLAEFSAGLFCCAKQYGIQLIGGDTTSGPLSITVQAAGSVPTAQALLRSGATVGDQICVSGELGGAALALQSDSANQQPLNRPEPQLKLGAALRQRATSCIDISDGLLADLTHILQQSGVGATLQLASVPLANGVSPAKIGLALAGGDDYQLLFTVAAAVNVAELQRVSGCKLTVIGEIEQQSGLRCVGFDGAPYNAAQQGWQHF